MKQRKTGNVPKTEVQKVLLMSTDLMKLSKVLNMLRTGKPGEEPDAATTAALLFGMTVSEFGWRDEGGVQRARIILAIAALRVSSMARLVEVRDSPDAEARMMLEEQMTDDLRHLIADLQAIDAEVAGHA